MLKISLFFLCCLFCCAAEVQITARHFSADEQALISVFTGSVIATRASDTMKADKMTVTFTNAHEVKRFEANGNASFSVTTEDNRHFNGEADTIIYQPQEGLYTLSGHAWIEDTTDKRKVVGEHIVLNELTKAINVSGEDALPVKLIFTLKDKNETERNVTDR